MLQPVIDHVFGATRSTRCEEMRQTDSMRGRPLMCGERPLLLFAPDRLLLVVEVAVRRCLVPALSFGGGSRGLFEVSPR